MSPMHDSFQSILPPYRPKQGPELIGVRPTSRPFENAAFALLLRISLLSLMKSDRQSATKRPPVGLRLIDGIASSLWGKATSVPWCPPTLSRAATTIRCPKRFVIFVRRQSSNTAAARLDFRCAAFIDRLSRELLPRTSSFPRTNSCSPPARDIFIDCSHSWISTRRRECGTEQRRPT